MWSRHENILRRHEDNAQFGFKWVKSHEKFFGFKISLNTTFLTPNFLFRIAVHILEFAYQIAKSYMILFDCEKARKPVGQLF